MRWLILLLGFICEIMWLWLDSIYDIVRYMIMVHLWDGEVCDYVPSTRWWGMWLHSICEMVRNVIMFHLWDGEVCYYVPSMRWWGLCWEMDDLHGTLGYNGQIGLRNLGGISEWWLPNIWCTHLTLETHRPHFANGLIYVVSVCDDHFQLSSMWLSKTIDT